MQQFSSASEIESWLGTGKAGGGATDRTRLAHEGGHNTKVQYHIK